jgi:hypothetical protein
MAGDSRTPPPLKKAFPRSGGSSAEDDEFAPHRAARGAEACGHETRHGLPPHRRQIQPPLAVSHSPTTSHISAARDEPRQGAEKLLRPHPRRLAHPHRPPRPDEPQVHGDEGPHLGEAGGAVDGPVGSRARVRVVGGRHCVWVCPRVLEEEGEGWDMACMAISQARGEETFLSLLLRCPLLRRIQNGSTEVCCRERTKQWRSNSSPLPPPPRPFPPR